MANEFLVHERNLDPDLIAKVNGLQTSDGTTVILSDYVKKSDLEQTLENVEKEYTEAIAAAEERIEDTYYKKTDKISKDSLEVAYNDIDQNTEDIDKLEEALDDLQNSLPDDIAAEVSKQLGNTGGNSGSGSGGSSSSEVTKEEFEALKDSVTQNTANISANASNIQENSDDIVVIMDELKNCRKLDVLIEKTDLSFEVQELLDPDSNGINDLKNSKQDVVSGKPGMVAAIGNENKLVTVDLITTGNFCYGTNEVNTFMNQYKNDIYDLKNSTHYTYSSDYPTWNSEIVINDNGYHEDNTTVAEGYQRVDIGTNYLCSPSDSVFINDTISFSENCNFTLGFYGTKIKLSGVYRQYTEVSWNAVTVYIDGNYDKTYTFQYVSKNETDTEDKSNYCLFAIEGLSEGRHLLELYIPDECGLELNPTIDIDDTNAAILKTSDFLTDYSSIIFDKQDTWETIPAEYGITKPDDLFDLSSLSTTDIYISEDYDFTDDASFINKLLYEEDTGAVYMIDSNGDVYILVKKSASTIDNIYPVGSVYTCTADTDPNTLWPDTTWEQLDVLIDTVIYWKRVS